MKPRLQRVIDELEKWLGVSLTIKDQAGILVDDDCKALFPDKVVHTNWFCPWRRLERQQWRVNCIEHCNRVLPAQVAAVGEAFVSPLCWKGLHEIIVPIFSNSTIAFIFYAGVFRERKIPSAPPEFFAEGEYLEKYRKLPIINEKTVQRIVQILTVAGNGILYELSCRVRQIPGRDGVIRKFISENYHRQIYLEDLARELHLSPSRASHFIKEHTGFPFSQLLLEERVGRVRNLLVSSDMSLNEIAAKTGFSNEYYLSRQFKRLIGAPPQQFRKSQKISTAHNV